MTESLVGRCRGSAARVLGMGRSRTLGPLHETTGLRTLLKNLRNRHDYPPQNLWLHVPARGTAVIATDYFHKLSDVTRETVIDDVHRAFWGLVSSAHDGGDGMNLWINCDSRGEIVTIRVAPDVKVELLGSMGITNARELEEAHVIVEGVLSQGPNKHFVPLTSVEKIAFLPKR